MEFPESLSSKHRDHVIYFVSFKIVTKISLDKTEVRGNLIRVRVSFTISIKFQTVSTRLNLNTGRRLKIILSLQNFAKMMLKFHVTVLKLTGLSLLTPLK
eukprot:g40600.t1